MKAYVPVSLALIAGLSLLIALPHSQAQVIAAVPDLKITAISENGYYAHITVRHAGTASSQACWLAAHKWRNNAWAYIASKSVPVLAPSESKVITF